jgi:hypothetical protein
MTSEEIPRVSEQEAPLHTREPSQTAHSGSLARSARSGPAGPDEQRSFRIFRRLLELRKDDAIAAVIDAAHSSAAARRLLRLAEEASECVDDGSIREPCARLFCVPLLVGFPEAMPATQLDAALCRLGRSGPWELHATDRGAAFDETAFVPDFLEAGDLVDLPLSSIRRGAIALLSGRSSLPPPHPFVRGNRPQRRASVFLRYLVGLRRLSAVMQPGFPGRIEVALRQELASFDATAAVFYDGTFREAAYTGLWAYQGRRLAEVAADLARHAMPRGVRASAAGGGTRLRPVIRVCFEETAASGSTGYALRCRPFENRVRACRRVAGIMRAAGVRVTVQAVFPAQDQLLL